jgi:hypothetical protein
MIVGHGVISSVARWASTHVRLFWPPPKKSPTPGSAPKKPKKSRSSFVRRGRGEFADGYLSCFKYSLVTSIGPMPAGGWNSKR